MTTRTIAGIFALLLLLQGCTTAPRFEQSFGKSVRANLAAQTIDPRRAANTNPATGIDGPAALAAQQRYQQSFVQPDSAANTPQLNTLGSGK
jgi:type IV pilus biogenesis protein CpaD/CtpE